MKFIPPTTKWIRQMVAAEHECGSISAGARSMKPKLIAFDCFGTIFDMSPIPREEIAAYVQHVRRNDFSPYAFPESWRKLTAHPDAAIAINMIQLAGHYCVAMSNGTFELIEEISETNMIEWDRIIDLIKHGAYKPNVEAYRAIEKQTDYKPAECLMVTANPTFGDVEGAAAIGMPSFVIHRDKGETLQKLVDYLGAAKAE